MDDIRTKTEAIRGEAWDALKQSRHFAAFKALDDAVVALGGQSIMVVEAKTQPSARQGLTYLSLNAARRSDAKRVSQAQAAIDALQEAGEPLPIGRLMAAALEKGAKIEGEKPLANFRSTVSKDPRFRSINRNNMYFWWFSQVPVPSKWNEASNLPLENGSDASSSNLSQEGDDSHAATTITS